MVELDVKRIVDVLTPPCWSRPSSSPTVSLLKSTRSFLPMISWSFRFLTAEAAESGWRGIDKLAAVCDLKGDAMRFLYAP